MPCPTPQPGAHRVMFAFRGDSAVLAVRGLTRDQANAVAARFVHAQHAWRPFRPTLLDLATPDGRTFAVRVADVVAAWVEAECACEGENPARKLMETQAALQAEAVRRLQREREERERGEAWRGGPDDDGETD